LQGNDGLASFEPNSRRKHSLPAIEGVEDVSAQNEGGSDVQNIQSLGPKPRSVRTRNLFSAGKDCIGNRHQVDDARRDVFGKQIEKPLNILSVEVLCKDSAEMAFVNSNSPSSDERIGSVVRCIMADAVAAWASGTYREKRKLVSA
jgi:hypothetical protein